MKKHLSFIFLVVLLQACGNSEDTRYPGGPGFSNPYHDKNGMSDPKIDLNERKANTTRTNADTSANRNTNNSQVLPPGQEAADSLGRK